MELESSVFGNNEYIPAKYSCDGEGISPPLEWKNVPINTKSYCLIVDDPDAPAGIWDHLILFNIPADTKQLMENLSNLPYGAIFGRNSWGKNEYGGPCPPSGTHRYFFTLYALDINLNLSASVTKPMLKNAMQGHVLATAQLIGKYTREKKFN